VRALNENSWVYDTDWFWHLGWHDHRFAIEAAQWLNGALQPCPQPLAAFMRVVLRKVQTSPAERVMARTFQCDPGLPEDPVPDSARAAERLAAYQHASLDEAVAALAAA